jgi:toxin-antitoxin system PIN domain toxin
MNPVRSQSKTSAPAQRHLLDVNLLLAAIWANHPQHARAFAWLSGKSVLLCPLSELGFLRISTNKKVINAPMAKARDLLKQFAQDRKAIRIADDLAALDSEPAKSEEVTDHYLADLAALHGARLATFDQSLGHASVEVIY